MTIGRQILVHVSGYTLQETMEHYFLKINYKRMNVQDDKELKLHSKA